MDISEFDYHLPPAAIAQHPAPERDRSRLLVCARGRDGLVHRVFRELPELLAPCDLLVLNRSRVLPARLLGQRRGGGGAEVLLLRPESAAGPPAPGGQLWRALVRPSRRLRAGDEVKVAPGFSALIASEAHPEDGGRSVLLQASDGTVEEAIERHGHVPLPPYIQRPDAPADRVRYQTVYAREPGSVAAPTAGLHFTPELFTALGARGIATSEVVLHVGPGTFLPVRARQVEEHRLPPEPYQVPEETAAAVAAARARGGRVVAVGTTAVRALESAAAEGGEVRGGAGETSLVIVPGHRFQAVDAMVTNFHLPRSSLLLLVCAFAGRARILGAYAEALARGYRFYSYGDAMLVL